MNNRSQIHVLFALGLLVFAAMACLLPVGMAVPALAADMPLPPDAGFVNVKDHGAKGDGVTDDTEAIRTAIKDGIEKNSRYANPPFVYFPKGTYLVTGPLESRVEEFGWSGGWRAGMLLRGESQEKSIIKLKDNLPDYADAAKPKWVIASGSESDKRTKAGDKPMDGGGNRAFRHAVMNLTVDVGDNPGAIGVDFVASNRGTVENVTIKAKNGYCGLGLTRHWPGPALVRNVSIEGFDFGIRVEHYQYGMTFEHIVLKGQKKLGIWCNQNVLAIRDLQSDNRVPVIELGNENGLIALIDAKLTGGDPQATAIKSKGQLDLRNVAISGYGKSLEDTGRGTPVTVMAKDGKSIESHVSQAFTLPAGLPPKPLNLPVKEAPEFYTGDFSQWANVCAFGATVGGDDDDAAGIQAAIDSGKPIVYLPNGDYKVGKTIIIRGNVRLILGMQSSIGPMKDAGVDPLIRFEGAHPQGTMMEHIWFSGVVEHASTKALAMRHCDFHKGYRNTAKGTGDMFIEDTIGKPIVIAHPQSVWGRSVNCEFGEESLIENHGGTLWMLGYKTEGEMVCIENKGGKTEVLGALLYPLRKPKADAPMLVNDGGVISISYAINGQQYNLTLKQRKAGAGDDAWQTFEQKNVGRRNLSLLRGDAGR